MNSFENDTEWQMTDGRNYSNEENIEKDTLLDIEIVALQQRFV